jgi:hypothetical protein
MLFLEEWLHCADFVDFCLASLGLLVKIMAFLGSNILRVDFMSVFIRVWLKRAFRILFLFLLLSHLLLLEILPQVVNNQKILMSKTLVRDLDIN